MRHIIYPLTGNPIHLGHIDAINRASKLIDKLHQELKKTFDMRKYL